MKLRIRQLNNGKYVLEEEHKFLKWAYFKQVKRESITDLYCCYMHKLSKELRSFGDNLFSCSLISSNLAFIEKLVEIYSVLYEIDKRAKSTKDLIIGEYNTEHENFISQI